MCQSIKIRCAVKLRSIKVLIYARVAPLAVGGSRAAVLGVDELELAAAPHGSDDGKCIGLVEERQRARTRSYR